MIVDLSVPINEDTPVYPGDPKTVIRPAGVLKDDYLKKIRNNEAKK